MAVSPAEYLRRRLGRTTHRLRSLPVLVLMPHGGCNCRCVMCDIWQANSAGTQLTVEEIAAHLPAIDRLRVRWVVLSGGEALLHRNLWTLTGYLRERGIKITLLSTGLLLARHAAAVVRECDEVIVSLDGPADLHDAIRGVPRAFEKLAAGVASLRAARPGYPVSGRSVVQRRNSGRLAETIAAARAIGLDSISFLAADVSSEAFNRPGGWDDGRVEDTALSAGEAVALHDEIEAIIATHAADIESGFIVESAAKLRRIPRYFQALSGAGELPPVVCNAPWVSAVVEADGQLRPCFFQPAYGSIHDGDLETVLNSPAAIAFRRDLDLAGDPICTRCVCTLQIGPGQAV